MYTLKIDKNEFTEKGVKKEFWGYALYNDTRLVKKEVIKSRVFEDDTRTMRYIRCYSWALEKILGYCEVNNITEDEIRIFLTSINIINWLETKRVNKIYRIAMDKLMGYIEEIPFETVKVNAADRNWAFRSTIVEGNKKPDEYMRLVDLITDLDVEG